LTLTTPDLRGKNHSTANHSQSQEVVMSVGRWKSHLIGLALGISTLAPVTQAAMAAESEVNIYSLRQPFLVAPLFEAFTKETGIKVNVVFAKKGLIQRLKSEGVNSPADLLFTVDVGRLNDAFLAGVTQAVTTPALEDAIPAGYRHPKGHWYGMTTRVRILYASRDRVKPGEIESYEDLAAPEWKGRVCTRSGKNSYNVALIASMIAHHGETGAEKWLEGVKANLARKPQGNDRAQVKAIHAGECDVAIGNHYYYGKMLEKKDQREWADSVYLVFPNQKDRGTHVNISGVAMTKAAPNKANAIRLMEFLAGPGQTLYAEQNYEYPVRSGVPWLPKVKAWGVFKPDELSLAAIAELRGAAIRMVDRVGFDG
jgi:iron(III) transport system substrate-binding protein